jgi:acyl carrier protein
MSDDLDRLMRCFQSVFPGLTVDEIRVTNAESSGVWDSLATVTLASVVQEEFDVEIDASRLPALDSYEAFRQYLCQLGRLRREREE